MTQLTSILTSLAGRTFDEAATFNAKQQLFQHIEPTRPFSDLRSVLVRTNITSAADQFSADQQIIGRLVQAITEQTEFIEQIGDNVGDSERRDVPIIRDLIAKSRQRILEILTEGKEE